MVSASGLRPGWRERAALGFIFGATLVNAISFGIILPVLPNLLREFTNGDIAAAGIWSMVYGSIWGAVQLFSAPLLGALSDRVGRRPVLLVSLFGLAVDLFLTAFAPNVFWLLAARTVNGVTAASFSTANAYVADVTVPSERARAFGWIGSALSIGLIAGPVLGGALAEVGLRLPFIVAGCLTGVNWVYGLLILPESLPPERRVGQFDLKRLNPLAFLRFLLRSRQLLELAGVGFLFQIANMVGPTVFVLYGAYRYDWSPAIAGLVVMLSHLLGAVVQIFLIGPVVARIHERGALLLGAGLGALAFALNGFAPTGWFYVAATPAYAGLSFLQPGLNGLMSRNVAPHEQGYLQGANQALRGVAAALGPIAFGLSFAWSIGSDRDLKLPGLAFFIASGLMVAAFFLGAKATTAGKT